jgi:hypothetical protein
MKRLVGALAAFLAACALVPAASSAAGPVAATGGGRGTTDGVHAFSDFGFSVMRSSGGAVEGHFNCLMAGSSQFPGFTLMAVRGQVTHAAIDGGTATFDGVGMFQTGNQGKSDATFHVVVTAGGPGVGTLHLTLLEPFFFDLPVEHVLHGQISFH